MKLKKLVFHYTTATARESFYLQVNVSKDGQFYFIVEEIPQEIWTLYKDKHSMKTERGPRRPNGEHSTHAYTGTLSLIEVLVKEAIENYEESVIVREETKVITFEFELAGAKSAGEDPDYFGGEGRRSYSSPDGLLIKFEWEILRKITNKGAATRYNHKEALYLDKDGSERYVGDDAKLVPWTKEREEWFKAMDNSMRTMMLNIEKFMGVSQQKLLQIMASGSIPMLGEAKNTRRNP